MPSEVELKLAINAADADALRHHPLLKAWSVGAPRQEHLHNIYFDTPQLDLTGQGYALRLRRIGRRWLQTLKGGGGVQGGLHRRDEWEIEVKRPVLDLNSLPDAAVRAILSPFSDRLGALFTTDFSRTAWELRTPTGDCIELALDQGEIASGERRCAISEVELELKSGNPASLFQLGLALQKQILLRPEVVNKAARGYALFLERRPAPQHAVALDLAPEAELASSLRSIAWNCLAQMQGNEDGLLHASDPEYLHQFRVGLRRLRAALGLFRLASAQAVESQLRRDLAWLMERLGPARDWEVCVRQTLPALGTKLEKSRLAVVLAAAEAQRKRAIATVRRAVTSRRYARLMLQLAAWVAQDGWQAWPAFQVPTHEFAQRALARRARLVFKCGKAMARPERRHALRIAVKKLRYAGEFFAALHTGRKVQRYTKRLIELQEVLGRCNDLAMTENRLSELAKDKHAGIRETVASMQERLRKQAKREAGRLDKAWHDFSVVPGWWERDDV